MGNRRTTAQKANTQNFETHFILVPTTDSFENQTNLNHNFVVTKDSTSISSSSSSDILQTEFIRDQVVIEIY